MGLTYVNLDEATRDLMVAEVEADIAAKALYTSPRLSGTGVREWPNLLLDAVRSGSDDTLADALASGRLLNTHEQSQRNGIPYTKRVPANASSTLAEGEFNRFYLRGLAARGLAERRDIVIVRGRLSATPRTESQALIGRHIDARTLLDDLRGHIGVDSALGLAGPNSGLTGKLA